MEYRSSPGENLNLRGVFVEGAELAYAIDLAEGNAMRCSPRVFCRTNLEGVGVEV
jgi:hypothetical protein